MQTPRPRLVYDAALEDPAEAGDALVGVLLAHHHLLSTVRHLDPGRIERLPTRHIFLSLMHPGIVVSEKWSEIALRLVAKHPDPTRFLEYLALVKEPS